MSTAAQKRRMAASSIGMENPNIGEAIRLHEEYIKARWKYEKWLEGAKTYLSAAEDADRRRMKQRLHDTLVSVFEHSKNSDAVGTDNLVGELGVTADLNPFAQSYKDAPVWETWGIDADANGNRMEAEWELWDLLFGMGVEKTVSDHDFIAGTGNEWWAGGDQRNEWATFGRRRLYAKAAMEYRAKRLIDFITTGRLDGTWETGKKNRFLTELAALPYGDQAVLVSVLTSELSESYFGDKFLQDQFKRSERHAGYTYNDDGYYETTGPHPNESESFDDDGSLKSYPMVFDPINLLNPYVEPKQSEQWAKNQGLPVANGDDNPIYTIKDEETYKTYFEPERLTFACLQYSGASGNSNTSSITVLDVTTDDAKRVGGALTAAAARFLAAGNLKKWDSLETQHRKEYFFFHRLSVQRTSVHASYGAGPYSQLSRTSAGGVGLFQDATSIDLADPVKYDINDYISGSISPSSRFTTAFFESLTQISEDFNHPVGKSVFTMLEGLSGMLLTGMLIVDGWINDESTLHDFRRFVGHAATFMQGLSSIKDMTFIQATKFSEEVIEGTSPVWSKLSTGFKIFGKMMSALGTVLTAYSAVWKGYSGDTDTAALFGVAALTSGASLVLSILGMLSWYVAIPLAVLGAATMIVGSLFSDSALVNFVGWTTFGEHHENAKPYPPKSNVSESIIGDYERWWINGFRFQENINRQLAAFEDVNSKDERIKLASISRRDTSNVASEFENFDVSTSAYPHTGHITIESIQDLDSGYIYLRCWDVPDLQRGDARGGRNELLHRIKLDEGGADSDSEPYHETAAGTPPVLEYRVRKEQTAADPYEYTYHLLISSAQNNKSTAFDHILNSPNENNQHRYCIEAIHVPDDTKSDVEKMRNTSPDSVPYTSVVDATEWFPNLSRHTYYLA